MTKVGIIGTGRIGSNVADLLRAAGHDVRLGARDPKGEQVSVDEAARFGEVVLVAVPYGVWPDLAPKIANAVSGKVVVDAGNPDPERDGDFGAEGRQHPDGSGAPVAGLLPNANLVRVFSTVEASKLLELSNPRNPTIAMPVAGDDAGAVSTVTDLVRDAGFDPIRTGNLASAKRFDRGADVFAGDMTAADARRSMGLPTDP